MSSTRSSAGGTKVVLYRDSLDVRSGAGQLIRMQADALRAAGAEVRIACERGRVKYFLRTGIFARRLTAAEARGSRTVRSSLLVDHGLRLPHADVVFVHSLLTEAIRFVKRNDWDARIESEAAFFEQLDDTTPIIANSNLVKVALTERFAIAGERVVVHYPGFRSDTFTRNTAERLRRGARAALRVGADTPLVGFITSGDFQTRGLDLFLASAERIARARPDVRFLVVGSKRLPVWAKDHALIAAGKLEYRPKSSRPERWFAALDLFLYAARFEEFGMVISEAQAMGVPVLTSRRVGAAECLPPDYMPWIVGVPDVAALAERALALLEDDTARRALALAGMRSVRAHGQRQYVEATLATILGQKR